MTATIDGTTYQNYGVLQTKQPDRVIIYSDSAFVIEDGEKVMYNKTVSKVVHHLELTLPKIEKNYQIFRYL